ncbi:MAG: hypothetical protein LKI25_03090 [Atopobiaceae bacterium]|jgi:hypothetical protein|nr:hypothetical protein [Atopobiaceae bacterium]MCI2173191.1 hypothetical protein [Atopobiaceae bacterium]MCI2207186.1 hypothetical protein [Atopobiaceae bacterium]
MSSASRILVVLSWVFRVAAILLALVVCGLCFANVPSRSALVGVAGTVTSWLPASLSGLLVCETPFDGAFRGDLAMTSAVLFVLDWLCLRISATLR